MATVKIRAHEGQRAILESSAFTTAAIAGTGGGKTVGGYPWLIKQMAQRPGQSWLVAEPTKDMLTRILLTTTAERPSLVDFLRMFDRGMIWERSKGRILHELGTVLLASADKPDSMQGAHVAGAWLDEAGMMKYLAFLVAQQRVGFLNGNILITTTPYNMGWLKGMVYDKGMAGDPDYNIVSFPSLANPNYPRESVERARASMSKTRFEMMYLGKFGRPEGMIYDCFEDDVNLVDAFPVPSEWDMVGGLDLGFNHPTAGVLLARDTLMRLYGVEEYYRRQTTLKQHAKALKAMGGGRGAKVTWYADPSAPQQILELRGYGLNVVACPRATGPGEQWVKAGIDLVYEGFQSRQLRWFRTLVESQRELGGYVWEGNELGVFEDKPVKDEDDLMDAHRYAAWGLQTRSGLLLTTEPSQLALA